MPYTPPSQQSPASSKNSTPAISRVGSYSIEHSVSRLAPPSALSSRPSLPRSVSSTSYLNRHRRSPSGTGEFGSHDGEQAGATSKSTESKHNGSVRQSPPPVNDLLIPTGAIISPPDSSENSDGDETASRGRAELQQTWGELQMAVRSINLKRQSSPERERTEIHDQRSSSSGPTTSVVSPTVLSKEARKISHSRSATETSITIPSRASFAPSPGQTSDDSEDDDDDDEQRRYSKPPLVRKKSGELVKPALRPSSRRRYSSMPGTPTYHKSVHFNDNGNQTRHFLMVDKPMAVSAGSSPAETYESDNEYPFEEPASASSKTEWEIKLANFPEESLERKTKPVHVERIFLSADSKSLVGTVACQNLSFHKLVVARFTLDYWKTTSEVVAEYSNDVRRQQPTDGCDRFDFSIRLSDQANLENKTLLLCIRFNVGGQEFWDNNENTNYQIDFVKKVKAHRAGRASSHHTPLGARPLNAIPRSKRSPPGSAGRGRAPSIDDDIVSRFDSSSTYHFGSPEQIIGELPQDQPIKLKARAKRGSLFPTSAVQPTNGLGGRYDFGASLSAALSTAQDKLGRSSGLMTAPAPKPGPGYFSREPVKHDTVSPSADASLDSVSADRPAMGSAQYKDLVQKFCYFTPGTSGKISPQVSFSASKPANNDGIMDTPSGSGSSTPSPDQSASPLLDGANESRSSTATVSPYISGSASPGSVTGHSKVTRVTAPVSFGYPYHTAMRDGYFPESRTPTAITG